MTKLVSISLVSMLVACTADPAETTDPQASSPACEEAKQHGDLAWIQTNVLTRSCALSSSCHSGAASQAGGLSLEAGKSHANLVGKPATTQPGWTRVVPRSHDQSYLMVSLGHAPGPMPRGGFMPIASPPLCDEKIEAIGRWIAAGAQP